MANNLKVRKVRVGSTDIGGLKSSRYEKMQVTFGVIQAADYAVGDTIIFSDVPSADVVRATIVAHAVSPVTLEVLPGTDLTSALPLVVGGSAVKISYIIEYIRGTGRVGGNSGGDLLQVTLGAS